ncbi:hypothetical protein [Acuticoccus sp.]|uniref:hypothetical protein n=1 Tax=Acuticoccus sp. TaxID=1904378 RepID=UPI003B51B5B3
MRIERMFFAPDTSGGGGDDGRRGLPRPDASARELRDLADFSVHWVDLRARLGPLLADGRLDEEDTAIVSWLVLLADKVCPFRSDADP